MVYVKNGSKYKWQDVIEMHERYPHANNTELAKLCDCSEKTVRYAQTKAEWTEVSVLEQEAANLDVDDVEALDLLYGKLIEVCSVDNPDIRALNALMTFLDKTGRLEPKGSEEAKWRQKVSKLSPSELVDIATAEGPVKSSQQEGSEDSLYR